MQINKKTIKIEKKQNTMSICSARCTVQIDKSNTEFLSTLILFSASRTQIVHLDLILLNQIVSN